MSKYNPSEVSQFDALMQEAANTAGVSYDLLRKQVWMESRFKADAKSPTGPTGIAQFTKNTARAMGLIVDPAAGIDERLDPSKALPAMARHMADLTKKFGGDELKAALAYNQGEGKDGSPQLAAFDAGNFGAISEEGNKYMRTLMDVSRSDRKGDFENFGGITPKAQGQDFDKWTEGSEKTIPEVQPSQRNLATGIKIEGADVPAPALPFGQAFWNKHHETLDEVADRSTFFGLGDATKAEVQNSTLGVAIRAGRADNGFDVFMDTITPTRWNSHEWTPDELAKIRAEVKNPDYISVVSGGTPENLDALIKLANENFELDRKSADAGLGAKLSAGVIGGAVDPLSYVPIAGQVGKAATGAKLINKALVVGAQAGALNVASEGIRTSVAGGEAHYAEAAIGGALFAGGMTAILDGAAKALSKAQTPDAPNVFASTGARLEARETARNMGTEDPTKVPLRDTDEVRTHEGTEYAEMPDGSVKLADGTVLGPANPANPQRHADFAKMEEMERSAFGVKLGGFTEIGLTIMRSENPEIRNIGGNLVRSPVGTESGTAGKFGATASDIHERLHAQDNRFNNQLWDAVGKAVKDPEFSTGGAKMSKREARQVVYKRAALAIERPELQVDLTAGEKKVMDLLTEHFNTKRELMENPAIFGNPNASSIFPNSRHKGTYVPHVYDPQAKGIYSQMLGPDGLQSAIKSSWMVSYKSRPEVKARVDEALAEAAGIDVKAVTPQMVEDYATRKAYGIAKTDEFTASSVLDDQLDGLVGIENNSFLEARNLFDSDMKTTLPDGSMFSVNDLRSYDMKTIVPAYSRRVNGDIAIMGATGDTTKALKDKVVGLAKGTEGPQKAEVKALQDVLKVLTGRTRRDPEGVGQTMLRSLQDMSFVAKNAYMGYQNVTEIAGMLAQGNVKAMLHGIPMLRDMAMRNTPVTGKTLKDMHGIVFGKELDDLIRPSSEEIANRLRDGAGVGKNAAMAVGKLKAATQEISHYSPWTRLLNGSSNYLLDAGRQGVLSDVVSAALAGKKTKWEKEGFLNGASISKEQWAGVKALITDHMERGADGKFTIKDRKAFQNDPRTMDLWRLGDKVADETMLRPHKVSMQDTKAFGAGTKMVMQFKNFTIRSLNSKFIKSFYEGYKNNRAIDQALTHVISLGLAGTYYVAQAHMKAQGLAERDRKEYLKMALDEKNIAYAALSRSSHTGAPLGVANIFLGMAGWDPALAVRSSILPKPKEEREAKAPRGQAVQTDTMKDFYSRVAQQIPGVGFASATAMTAFSAAGYAGAKSRPDEQDYLTSMFNYSKELLPNDALTQQLILKIYEANGINMGQKKR